MKAVLKMETNNTHHLLSAVLKILKMMVEAGAEIYRIEESATMIFTSYGFKNIDIYATTSNIIISLETEEGVIKTHTRRIEKISTDIEKVHCLNMLVRDITSNKPTYEYIEDQIEKIHNTNKYPILVNIFFYGVIAGAFYFFFGGRNFSEFLISTVTGLCTGSVSVLFERFNFNKILIKFILSFIASFIAVSVKKIGIIGQIDNIIIANIMTLIPGIGLTNSLRDLFVGDNISGVLRLIEAAISALAIACGYVAVLVVFGGVV